MAMNPHLVSRKPSDPGAIQSIVDLDRRLRAIERQYGTVGAGATITAPTIQTSDSNPRVIMDVFGIGVLDSGGNTQASLSINGLAFNIGQESYNKIQWESGSTTIGEIYTSLFSTPATDAVMIINVAKGSKFIELDLSADSSSGFVDAGLTLSGAISITLGDQAGNASWPGSVSAHSFITTSDRSLKTSIEDLGDLHLKLHSLRPIRYQFKGRQETSYGFVAQELANHLPEVVRDVILKGNRRIEGDHGSVYKGIDYASIVTLLVAAVQDLHQRISSYESKDENARGR